MIAAAVLAAAIAVTPASNGTLGVVPPLEIDAKTRDFMECVGFRESRNDPGAVSASGKHRGRFQVTPAMGRGMAWHLLPWLRTWHPDARRYAAKLRSTPVNRWPVEMQDAAFVLTLHHDGKRWSGWRHWYLAGSACNALVPRSAR